MIRSIFIGTTVALAASSASAALVGGVFLTDPDWNAAASSAIGQTATVTRLFAAFDDPDNTAILIDAGQGTMRARGGLTLYQNEFGSDTSSGIMPALFDSIPSVEWDSYVGLGALYAPNSAYTSPDFSFSADGANGSWAATPGSGVPTIFPGHAGGPNGTYDEDSGYWLVFLGQFTLLGDPPADERTSVPDFTGHAPYLASNLFRGSYTYFSWIDSEENRNLTFTHIPSNPSPGASVLFGIAGLTARRRR